MSTIWSIFHLILFINVHTKPNYFTRRGILTYFFKFSLQVPIMIKLISYFQYVPTISFLMIVWNKVLKTSNQLLLSHIFHFVGSQHDKNKLMLSSPQYLNYSSKPSEYFLLSLRFNSNVYSYIKIPFRMVWRSR